MYGQDISKITKTAIYCHFSAKIPVTVCKSSGIDGIPSLFVNWESSLDRVSTSDSSLIPGGPTFSTLDSGRDTLSSRMLNIDPPGGSEEDTAP